MLNLGVPGHNTWNELQVYRHLGRPLDADVVVIGFFLNDVSPIISRSNQSKSVAVNLVGKTALFDAFRIHVRWRLKRSSSGLEPEEVQRASLYRENEALITNRPELEIARPYWDESMRTLAEVRADGALPMVVCFPGRGQVDAIKAAGQADPSRLAEVTQRRSAPQALVAGLCTRLEVPILDLLPPFVEAPDDPFGRVDRGHPSSLGYAVSAERVAEELVRLGWI